ncbi:bifunctional demethylmenaquinone methyltransferase/2-methoxy-6-polyprenyl-1,4-benzoquinol methylase UbiE [Candidatus Chlamydia sanziniae]|uniref:Demethylmenaquinone methyltransferase n=1 Tax=Candidatus Chlamydia sanziniae TaxID=1806891 RepID=A0A1A9HV82_9CHLA|nr:bifunctional demethylmenaquinone methyltransferase/2-methoxy-6-polyprenyl-1,4-benzoquinol methylase UbiE [Candidatus Chlamydia sanziniae]ANH78311.1 Ubiquinone/menaquinone biosynthesis methyltransferase UbiE [Candidatus Chlamydia sanziniae]
MKHCANQPNLQKMFNTLAPRYDKINAILSLGMHHFWNRTLIQLIGKADHLIDLCAGTGKVASRYISYYPKATATLVDFSPEMLFKAKQLFPHLPFTIVHSDITHLPIANASQTLATMAYGLRNLPDPHHALKEIYRILQFSGKLGILELTCPIQAHPAYLMHKLYLKAAVPLIGRLYSRDPLAYRYLSTSVQNLPKDQDLEELFIRVGFRLKKKRKLCLGAATIWLLEK